MWDASLREMRRSGNRQVSAEKKFEMRYSEFGIVRRLAARDASIRQPTGQRREERFFTTTSVSMKTEPARWNSNQSVLSTSTVLPRVQRYVCCALSRDLSSEFRIKFSISALCSLRPAPATPPASSAVHGPGERAPTCSFAAAAALRPWGQPAFRSAACWCRAAKSPRS